VSAFHLGYGFARLASVLQQATEIYIWRLEVRLEADALSRCIYGAEAVAGLGKRNAIVEVCGMYQLVI
jgi:hypothetical protein